MPCNVDCMSQYQRDLYKGRCAGNFPNRTYDSTVFQNSQKTQLRDAMCCTTNSSSSCPVDVGNREENVKTPWGRSRSYAGDGPIYLPTEHRPKCEPPRVLQRTHQHFGSGLFPHPRGYPFMQYYDLTQLRKSEVRSNDELRVTAIVFHHSLLECPDLQQVKYRAPSQFSYVPTIFPVPQIPIAVDPLSEEEGPALPAINSYSSQVHPPKSTVVVQKVMGNFARREIYTPQTGNTFRQPLTCTHNKIDRLQIQSPWFSRHEVMTQFNKQYSTVIPRIDLNIQKKKQPSWLHNGSMVIRHGFED